MITQSKEERRRFYQWEHTTESSSSLWIEISFSMSPSSSFTVSSLSFSPCYAIPTLINEWTPHKQLIIIIIMINTHFMYNNCLAILESLWTCLTNTLWTMSLTVFISSKFSQVLMQENRLKCVKIQTGPIFTKHLQSLALIWKSCWSLLCPVN